MLDMARQHKGKPEQPDSVWRHLKYRRLLRVSGGKRGSLRRHPSSSGLFFADQHHDAVFLECSNDHKKNYETDSSYEL